jgi:hypothetical protein
MYAPFIRIFLRYGVGAIAGLTVGDMLASDPDVVDVIAAGVSVVAAALTEWWYQRARRSGGPT